MPTSLGQKREIYWWFTQDYKRITIGSLKNSFRNLLTLKWVHIFYLERRRNPQISSRSGPETALTRLPVDHPVDRSKYVVDQSVDRTNFRTYCKCRSIDQMGFSSSCNIGRPPGRSISILVHVGRPNLWHRVKKLYPPFFLPSLHSPPRWRFFKSESNSNELLGKIDTRSQRNWHTILTWALLAKLMHDLGEIDIRSRLGRSNQPVPKNSQSHIQLISSDHTGTKLSLSSPQATLSKFQYPL